MDSPRLSTMFLCFFAACTAQSCIIYTAVRDYHVVVKSMGFSVTRTRMQILAFPPGRLSFQICKMVMKIVIIINLLMNIFGCIWS